MKNQAARFHTVQKQDALAQYCQRFYRDRLKDLFHSHMIHVIDILYKYLL